MRANAPNKPVPQLVGGSELLSAPRMPGSRENGRATGSDHGFVTDLYAARDRARMRIAVAMVVVSFFIYATGVLMVHRDQKNLFFPERSSIAAAVSDVVYGAPLGKVYSGLLEKLLTFDLPMDQTLAQAARHDLDPGTLKGATADGNGIGYIVVASASMRLFGPHASSIVLGMLILMGVSMLAFLSRYRDERALVVVLYFTALTVMLFMTMVWSDFARQISIGGIRYFSLIAILPGFHLLLECADTRQGFRGARKFVPMVVQVVILFLAVLVRNEAVTVIAAIVAGCALVAWRHRREPAAAKRVLGKAAYLTLTSALFVGCMMLSVSRSYVSEGRFTETLWHRIFVSLALNPEWPFGDLRQRYDCTRFIPQGLGDLGDQEGHCVLWVYAMKHHIPIDVVPTMTYGREYDAALREAFFNILRLYPAQTLKTFYYYKVIRIPWSLAWSLELQLTGLRWGLAWLFFAALANLVAFAAIPSPLSSLRSHRLIAVIALLFGVFSLLPLIAAWANPSTDGDLLFYCLFGIGLAATALIQRIRVTRKAPSPA